MDDGECGDEAGQKREPDKAQGLLAPDYLDGLLAGIESRAQPRLVTAAGSQIGLKSANRPIVSIHGIRVLPELFVALSEALVRGCRVRPGAESTFVRSRRCRIVRDLILI